MIDYDYRGEIGLILFNHSDTDFKVTAGDRMAQLILERIVTPEVVVVDQLEGTERGAGGFGSTGGFGPATNVVVAEQNTDSETLDALAQEPSAAELTAAAVGGV